MTDMQYTTLSFEEILERLCEPMDTLVLFHRNPDADAVGSAFALRQVLESLGSQAYCICQDEVPLRLRFLMHDLQDSVLPDSIPEDFTVERIISVDTASTKSLAQLMAESADLPGADSGGSYKFEKEKQKKPKRSGTPGVERKPAPTAYPSELKKRGRPPKSKDKPKEK